MKNYLRNLFDTQNLYIAPAIILGVSMLVCALIVKMIAIWWLSQGQSITVTGTAERLVQSDTGKLTVVVSERSYGEGASASVSKLTSVSAQKVVTYLTKSGFKPEEIGTNFVSLSPICELNNQGYENCSIGVKGQIGTQNIFVNSKNIELIKSVAGKIGSEMTGINITGVQVEYLFNGLKDIRVDMLTEATKNARERAEAVARAGGSRVGALTSLSSGVFQVTAPNSVNVEDYGSYDTSTIDKKVSATVKANFSIR